jgi:exosortase B
MSSQVTSPADSVAPALPSTLFGLRADAARGILIYLIGFVVLFFGTYSYLAQSTWATDEQGHGPLIIGAAFWLLWTRREKVFEGEARPAPLAGLALLMVALVMFAVGRSQSIIELEASAQIPILAAGLLLLHGPRALRRAWFPLAFLCFAVPLPGALVQAVTMPLKHAVSVVAEEVLWLADYPIGRTGVTLTIGQYHLLVADACSGLNSLFTLESLGLLYMNIMNYQSRMRNVLLAVMIVPISFISNVTRVIILVLITYYMGDEMGQGFAHEFAGLVLFSVAMILTYGADRLLAARFDDQGGQRGAVR